MASKIKALVQRVVITTSFFPFTCAYRMAYALSVAVAVGLFRRMDGVLAVYLRRGVARGEVVYGLSDIDLLVIVRGEDEDAQHVKERVWSTYDRLSRFVPLFGNADKELGLYSASEFFRLYEDYDFYRYRFNEGKSTWRVLAGRNLFEALPQLEDCELYLPALEELKAWWTLVTAELTPQSAGAQFERKYRWYKAISEASKIYLLVRHGQHVQGRGAALRQIKDHLPGEQHYLVERLQDYLKHLTGKEEVLSDELMGLFVMLVQRTFEEVEGKVFGDLEGKAAILHIPARHDFIVDRSLANMLEKLKRDILNEAGQYLDRIAIVPQVEFNMDVLANTDIDSLYFVLVLKNWVPVEKLKEIHSLFAQDVLLERIEPFIVLSNGIALSLECADPYNCIKSPKTSPLFFSLLSSFGQDVLDISRGRSGGIVRVHLTPAIFEQRIRKRVTKISTTVLDKNIYRMKPLDLLKFFWAAARTKLVARSLEGEEVHIPLTSRQILERLLESFPEDSAWLRSMYGEYARELRGEENESYRYFEQCIAFLNRI